MTISHLFRAAIASCLVLFAGFARAEEQGLELAPNNPDVLALVEVGKIIDSPLFAKITSAYPEVAKALDQPLEKDSKLTPRSFSSIFVAANTEKQDFVIVFNLTQETEIDAVLSEEQQTKGTKIGEYTLYTLTNGQALCLVDETTIAVGPAKTLTAVLKRDDEAEVSEALSSAWENIGDDQQIYIVATLDKLVKQGASQIPAGLPITPEMLANLKIATFTANTDKKNLTLTAGLDCTNADTANQLKALLDLGMRAAQQDETTPAEVKEVLRSVKAKTDEETLTINFQVGFEQLLEQFKGQINGAIGAQ
ncbi:hypothetical protein [Anatilimnocola floriformis]|uniref:hypothetical protein n=1 Tax=Anatilimnocola floriformis TaxID=2948575 RepID=UPI0020C22E3B|nr:hypothetical protein [Anatilimnocola floriformis]